MYSRPTLPDLITRTANDVVSRIPDPDALRRSDAAVYARVLAGLAHGEYGYIEWLARQLIYDTAEGEYLDRWASIWSITRKPATAAGGTVTFTGSNGAIIPAGAILVALDGQTYTTAAEATIASGSATATVTASAVGAAGNRTTGALFSLQSPVAGVAATATAGAMTGGADAETDDALRARFLLRLRQIPQGGAASDYVQWALAVPGVTRAWCYPIEDGLGTVRVRFMMDDTYADGIPLSGDVTAVANYIDPLRPVTADVYVSAPTASPLNFTISGLSPNTLATKNAITAALTDLIRREASPGGTLLISHIREAISTAAGEVDHVLSSPSANVVASVGAIKTMGTITWV